jgi:hypothetical protein
MLHLPEEEKEHEQQKQDQTKTTAGGKNSNHTLSQPKTLFSFGCSKSPSSCLTIYIKIKASDIWCLDQKGKQLKPHLPDPPSLSKCLVQDSLLNTLMDG